MRLNRLAKRWSPQLIAGRGRFKQTCKAAAAKYRKELTAGVFLVNTLAITLMATGADFIGGSLASITNIVMAAAWIWE